MFVCLNFDIFHFFWWLGCVHYYARIGAFLSLSFREIYCCCRHRRRRWRQGEFKLRAKIHIDDLCQCRYFIELMAFSVVCCTTIIYICHCYAECIPEKGIIERTNAKSSGWQSKRQRAKKEKKINHENVPNHTTNECG